MITHRGFRVGIRRQYMNSAPGWWFDAIAPDGSIAASGWTVGYGPRARTQAGRDARAAIDARLVAIAAKEAG